MAFGLKVLPQGDKSAKAKHAPKPGPDDDSKTNLAQNLTSPNMPDRDGPARDSIAGKSAGKPPTSAPVKAENIKISPPKVAAKIKAAMPSAKTVKDMKKSLGGLGRF